MYSSKFNFIIKTTVLVLTLSTTIISPRVMSETTKSSQNNSDHNPIKSEVIQFFDRYLDTYNQRFGQPEKRAEFISALSELINSPFLMSPPTSIPFQPANDEQLTMIFDGFVQQLEQKGAVKLIWKSVNLKVLTAEKILANNIGVAVNGDGEVVYETISVYLVNKVEGDWKISLFSPYNLESGLVLAP